MKEKKKIGSELKSKLLEAGFLPQINEEYYFKSYFRSAIFAYPDDMTFEEEGSSAILAPYRAELIRLNFKERKGKKNDYYYYCCFDT